MNVIKGTPVKISTMTIVSSLGSEIDLGKVYDNLQLQEKNERVSLISVEYADKPIRGENKKKTMKRRSKTPRKVFYNQTTFLYHDPSKANGRPVNVKVFNNGSCQMTGVQSLSCVSKIIDNMIYSLKSINNDNDILKTPETMKIGEVKICLINSGFSIKRNINRVKLHEVCEKLNVHADYEPSIYPAVNIKYYLNPSTSGVCNCQCICDGKGSGYELEDGNCKRITVAVFESGEVLICGRTTEPEIKKAYDFINQILKENKEIFSK